MAMHSLIVELLNKHTPAEISMRCREYPHRIARIVQLELELQKHQGVIADLAILLGKAHAECNRLRELNNE